MMNLNTGLLTTVRAEDVQSIQTPRSFHCEFLCNILVRTYFPRHNLQIVKGLKGLLASLERVE